MRLRTITLLIFLTYSLVGFAQQAATFDEVLEYFQNNRENIQLDSIFRWDGHKKIRSVLDEKFDNRIDTLILLSISYPGYIFTNTDPCLATNSEESFFFWTKNGTNFSQTVIGNCIEASQAYNGKILSLLLDNFTNLQDEFFIASTEKGEKTEEGLKLSMSVLNHEPKYEMLLMVNNSYNFLSFGEYDLMDSTSMFHAYNRNLKMFDLFELINKEIKN